MGLPTTTTRMDKVNSLKFELEISLRVYKTYLYSTWVVSNGNHLGFADVSSNYFIGNWVLRTLNCRVRNLEFQP